MFFFTVQKLRFQLRGLCGPGGSAAMAGPAVVGWSLGGWEKWGFLKPLKMRKTEDLASKMGIYNDLYLKNGWSRRKEWGFSYGKWRQAWGFQHHMDLTILNHWDFGAWSIAATSPAEFTVRNFEREVWPETFEDSESIGLAILEHATQGFGDSICDPYEKFWKARTLIHERKQTCFVGWFMSGCAWSPCWKWHFAFWCLGNLTRKMVSGE